jgi:hypothetical protein
MSELGRRGLFLAVEQYGDELVGVVDLERVLEAEEAMHAPCGRLGRVCAHAGLGPGVGCNVIEVERPAEFVAGEAAEAGE